MIFAGPSNVPKLFKKKFIAFSASWRRTLSPCTTEVKAKAFKSLVKPQLDYACEAWNPTTITDINQLEQVQRQGTGPAARSTVCL